MRKVCELLTSTYLTYDGETSSLHIHIRCSDAGFNYRFLRDFLWLLWAFEPQIDTRHPSHRRNTGCVNTMRDTSLLSLDGLARYGRKPSAMEGIAVTGKESSILGILTLTAEKETLKMDYIV